MSLFAWPARCHSKREGGVPLELFTGGCLKHWIWRRSNKLRGSPASLLFHSLHWPGFIPLRALHWPRHHTPSSLARHHTPRLPTLLPTIHCIHMRLCRRSYLLRAEGQFHKTQTQNAWKWRRGGALQPASCASGGRPCPGGRVVGDFSRNILQQLRVINWHVPQS